jgi:DhnA family fructose-bisphosphate aldolase class Ia
VGIATSLGADFVKIKPPHDDNKEKSADILASLVDAAGNTKLICSGGPLRDVDVLLSNIHNELHNGKTSGVALGRNLFQRPFDHAVALTEAVDALIYDDASYNDALNLYNTHKDKK